MTEPIWNQFLTERDKQVFAAAGYGARAGFGQRPALLVIDVNYNFCGDRREPILESIKRWRNSCGAEAWDGVARIRELIDAAHRSEERRVGKEWRGERAKEQGNKKWTRQAET